MSTPRSDVLPQLKIAVVNFGPGGTDAEGANRWDAAMRWDATISVLRAWQPHIVLGQEICASAPGGLRTHLWLTANTLGMVPVLGLASAWKTPPPWCQAIRKGATSASRWTASIWRMTWLVR